MSSIVREEASKKLGKFILTSAVLVNYKRDLPGYVDSYLTKDNKILIIVNDETSLNKLIKNKFYVSDYQLPDESTIVVLNPDSAIKHELDKFRKGKWSEFSVSFVNLLKMYSNLPYKVVVDKNGTTQINTHTLFLAIEKHETLRKNLEQELGCSIKKSQEYMQKPSSINFAEFEDFFNEEITTDEQ